MVMPEGLQVGDKCRLLHLHNWGPPSSLMYKQWGHLVGKEITVKRFHGDIERNESGYVDMVDAYVEFEDFSPESYFDVGFPKNKGAQGSFRDGFIEVVTIGGKSIDEAFAAIRARADVPNLAMSVPREAVRNILQLAPTPSILSINPAKDRVCTIYAIDHGPAGEVAFRSMPCAWYATMVLIDRRKPKMNFTIHAVDEATVMDDAPKACAYTLANVHAETGGLCWGLNTPPQTVRAAHLMFWGAPFNAHLNGLPRHDERHCPYLNRKCKCKTRAQNGYCEKKHKCDKHATVAQDPMGDKPRHEHKCRAKEWRCYVSRMERRGHRVDGPPVPCESRVKHATGYRTLPVGSSESTIRAYIKRRQYHLDEAGVKKYKRTLANTFGPGYAQCPCLCCATERQEPRHENPTLKYNCGCRSECFCCNGMCECLNVCDCSGDNCECPRNCECCEGKCRCPKPEACRCDRNKDFAKVFTEWKPGDMRTRKSWIGTDSIDVRKSVDVMLMTSDPYVLNQLPESFQRNHPGKGSACKLALGYGRRLANGDYLCTFRDKYGAEKEIMMERARLTLC